MCCSSSSSSSRIVSMYIKSTGSSIVSRDKILRFKITLIYYDSLVEEEEKEEEDEVVVVIVTTTTTTNVYIEHLTRTSLKRLGRLHIL